MPVEGLSPRILVVRYFLFVIFFLFETRYILQLKKAKRNNQPNKRYPQCLVYTCNLCLQNSVKTQLTKKYQLNRQHSNFFFNNFCIFFNIFEKKVNEMSTCRSCVYISRCPCQHPVMSP